MKMTMSVKMLIPPTAKYVVRRSLHPLGNVGDHACDGFGLHSNAYSMSAARYEDRCYGKLTLTKRTTIV